MQSQERLYKNQSKTKQQTKSNQEQERTLAGEELCKIYNSQVEGQREEGDTRFVETRQWQAVRFPESDYIACYFKAMKTIEVQDWKLVFLLIVFTLN